MRGEAARLVNALRAAPKARGRWGEQQLRNVLETLRPFRTCRFPHRGLASRGEDGRMRPDVIIRVPGGRALVIDAKVSLNAYQDAYEAVDDGERAAASGSHAAAMKAHVNGLGGKAYWAEFDDAPDYVIMFVPGEHFLSAALEHDPTLVGLRLRQARAAGDADQPDRDRAHGGGGVAAGRAGARGQGDRRARQGDARPAGGGGRRISRRWAAG